jgi:diadenosine tetraphosphate (Ap4A) HIT family hydrolase
VTRREPGCPLCDAPGGRLVVQAPRWRLVHADEAGFPAFYRVVWNEHAREFSQLSPAERAECIEVAVRVEEAMLRHLRPTKVNLATLGNAVPHLHWHVIGRFDWDSHFPGPVWAQALRPRDDVKLGELSARLATLEEDLRSRLPGGA